MKKQHTKKKATSKENLEERFNAGEDVSDYFDLDNAEVSEPSKRIVLDCPAWVVDELDREAKRRGMPRQAVIKSWLVDILDELRQKHGKRSA